MICAKLGEKGVERSLPALVFPVQGIDDVVHVFLKKLVHHV